ncbi:MAG: hypothetical protein MJZ67_06390 [Bacteroidales bacterium]|nr:hypothetical protein [Bacteroidales bacterium]
MTRIIFNNIARFIALLLLQVMVLNYVYLGGYILPFVYLLAVLMLPTRMGRIPLLLVAFATGMIVDIFCNIPGFHTFSCTAMAFVRIVIGNRILTRDDPDAVIDTPNIHTVPLSTFAGYSFLLVLVYCATYGLLEVFSFGNFFLTLLGILVNTIVAWGLSMLFQLLIPTPKK